MYKASDYKRQIEFEKIENYRSDFRRDFSRLLHSSSFRRLHGKTQLFPGFESDFFRNRLTHSLEVAQISKSIALKINQSEEIINKELQIDTDLVEFAALAHDLGHPPFGHNGEYALDDLLKDVGGYEGNAQTFRVLTKIEKKVKISNSISPIDVETHEDLRRGLNLTFRSLASILKYDNKISSGDNKREKPEKGFYYFDDQLVKEIKEAVSPNYCEMKFKTIECSIMDIADDIAYSTYDLEDALKAGFVNPLDFTSVNSYIVDEIKKRLPADIEISNEEIKDQLYYIFEDFFIDTFNTGMNDQIIQKDLYAQSLITNSLYYIASKEMCQDGYLRTQFTSKLIKNFMNGIIFDFNSKNPEQSKVYFEDNTYKMVEVLKQYNYVNIINSPMLRVSEHRGRDIVSKIFDAISKNPKLLPRDYQEIYNYSDETMKKRTIGDFVAGMTDRYAIEFYCRLFSESPESIFKPI
ncbi:MAG TPA: dNTP triphosphohydrolase [Spirochaetota bacterium]|nr:dNTP triphosphohydrolase [Spirochaetota bacterium]HOR44618.1 dNTP triphosphohydrolase [Spirochaetota bacterium]HPK56136.1 dNTP triphosphohydrolase [Spirochaetota bacterium]